MNKQKSCKSRISSQIWDYHAVNYLPNGQAVQTWTSNRKPDGNALVTWLLDICTSRRKAENFNLKVSNNDLIPSTEQNSSIKYFGNIIIEW